MFDHSHVESVAGRGSARVSLHTITICALSIQALRQPAAGMMQKATRIFGGMHHLKAADVEGVDFGQISAAAIGAKIIRGFISVIQLTVSANLPEWGWLRCRTECLSIL